MCLNPMRQDRSADGAAYRQNYDDSGQRTVKIVLAQMAGESGNIVKKVENPSP